MVASTLLTVLAILVALLTAAVYLLQIIELLEKRIPRVIGWVKKHQHKRVGTRATELLLSPPSGEQHEDAQENLSPDRADPQDSQG